MRSLLLLGGLIWLSVGCQTLATARHGMASPEAIIDTVVWREVGRRNRDKATGTNHGMAFDEAKWRRVGGAFADPLYAELQELASKTTEIERRSGNNKNAGYNADWKLSIIDPVTLQGDVYVTCLELEERESGEGRVAYKVEISGEKYPQGRWTNVVYIIMEKGESGWGIEDVQYENFEAFLSGLLTGVGSGWTTIENIDELITLLQRRLIEIERHSDG